MMNNKKISIYTLLVLSGYHSICSYGGNEIHGLSSVILIGVACLIYSNMDDKK